MKRMLVTVLCLLLLSSCAKAPGGVDGYAPYADIPPDYSLASAKADGLVVYEDGSITSGQSVWDEFLKNSQSGTPCMVRLGFSYAEHVNPYVQDLSYDGAKYALYSVEEGKEYLSEYKYMKMLVEKGSGDAIFTECVRYVLVNDSEVTWEQIFAGMVSSQYGAWIDHKTVYSKYTYK